MSKVFLHLLNISITAGWIVLIVVLLRFVLKKAPKWIRVVLWGLVALRLLLPVTIESVTSLVPSAETVKIESVTAPVVYPVNESNYSSYHIKNVQGDRIVLQSGFPALNSAVNPPVETAVEHVDTVATVKTVAGWVWLAGVVGMLFYALVSFLRLRLRVRASVKLEKGVYVCDEIRDPFILGLIFPKIYLPSGMDEATRNYVLSHERAHLKRFDHIWKPLGFLLLSVYWFNPLLWLAYILLCRDIELACDEKVIRELDDTGKAAYSEALVTASVSRRMVSACPLAFGETGVKSRVKSVLNYKKPAFWIILIAILACIVVAVCFLTMPKKDKAPETEQSAAEPEDQSPATAQPDPEPTDAEPALTPLPTSSPEVVNVSSVKVLQWLDYFYSSDMPWDSTKEITVAAFPNVTFRWTSGSVEAIENGKTRTLFQGMPVWNVYFADVTGDGRPELLSTVSFGSGVIDEHIVVYDYENKQSYTLWGRFKFDYHLYMAEGMLCVGKMPYNGDKQVDYGTLELHDGVLSCRWQSDGSFTPLNRMLHESELIGEWLVEEEKDSDGNVLYTFAVDDLWKEYNFREDGTVVYNETVPISSDYEKAFGHPVEYPYEVHDGYVYIAGDDTSGAFRWGYYDRETHRLTLSYNTAERTVNQTLKRMGFDKTQTLEDKILGVYPCTGAKVGGKDAAIPTEYVGMKIDLGDSFGLPDVSWENEYYHIATVTIGGEEKTGYDWLVDANNVLTIWNDETGDTWTLQWIEEYESLLLTLDSTDASGEPIVLIFGWEWDYENAATSEPAKSSDLSKEQADAFVNGLSVEFEDGAPYSCDLVCYIDGFGECLNIGDPEAYKSASVRFEPTEERIKPTYPHFTYAKILCVGDREYYLGNIRLSKSDDQMQKYEFRDNDRTGIDASIFVPVDSSMMERNRACPERVCVIKAFDAEKREVTISFAELDEPEEDGYPAAVNYDAVEEETYTFRVTDDTMLSLIVDYQALVKPDRFFKYLEAFGWMYLYTDSDDPGVGFWIGIDGDTLLYLCEVYEE